MNIKNILGFMFIILVSFSFVVGQSETCKDSDNGEDYFVKGTVTGLEEPDIWDTWIDYCGVVDEEEGKLVEYICGSEDYGQKVLYSCPNGYHCENGACVETNHLLVVDESSPANDVIIITDIVDYFQEDYGNVFLSKLNKEVTVNDLDYRVTVFVYKSNAVIIVGKHSPTDHTILGTEISEYLKDNKGISAAFKLSSEVTDDDLKEALEIPEEKCRDENYECYVGDLPCCSDLKKVPHAFEDNNGQCIAATCGSICRPCGNGVCDANENRCNCPEDCKTAEKCAKEGEYTSGAVAPEYYKGCCEGLKGFDTHAAEWAGGGLLCYDPKKGTPVCKKVGTRSEGWYYSSGGLLRYDICGKEEIKEQVKCVFKGSTTTQECYSEKGRCKGVETCVVDIQGKEGEKVTWKSTCGGYAYTTIDGKDEYAEFSCGTEVIYVKLGEKFSLAERQSAKVTDYNYMKITLNEIINIVCIKAPCPQMVEVQVEMPCNIKPDCEEETGICEECATTATQFKLSEGESKEVFGAELTFLSIITNRETGKNYARFTVNKAISYDLVDIEIQPVEQTIAYGEKAVYKVTVTDKHPIPTCPEGSLCELKPLIYNYKIQIRNLPFSKEYPKEIEVPHGRSESFELVVRPYEVVEAEITGVEKTTTTITGKTVESTGEKVIAKPVKISKIAVSKEEPVVESMEVSKVETVAISTGEIAVEPKESEEEPAVMVTPPIHLMKRYKFSITAKSRDNYEVQDTTYAVLNIKPETPPTPPPFPGEKVSIKLYKGWNLISLPGKLIKFDKEGIGSNKLIGFVYIKEEQEYVSLNEAEKILGDKLREYLAKNAFWIYSRTPSTLNVWVDRKISYQDLELVKGWNLVPITEDMLGGYLTDILADCNLEKMHLWDVKNQKWEKISLEYSFSANQFGYGFLVKANDYCRLVGPDIIAPPAMPE